MTKSLDDDFLQKNKEAVASPPPAPSPATEEDVVAAFPTISSTGSQDSEKKTAETDAGSFKIATEKRADDASQNQGAESTESEASIAAEKWKEEVAATVESTESTKGDAAAPNSTKKTVKLPSIEDEEEPVLPGVNTLQPHNSVSGAVFASLLKNKDLEECEDEVLKRRRNEHEDSANKRRRVDLPEEEVTSSAMVTEAWQRLKDTYVYFQNKPVGTLAAMDPTAEALNYDQVFVRDFIPAGLACLMKEPAEPEIVKNFLLNTLFLQGREKKIDGFTLGAGVLPASFKVVVDAGMETIEADYGGSAIGRVSPVDSGFWWIILLKAYVKKTLDYELVESPEVQNGMKLILNLCLSDGFDTCPTLLCADGCSMIDRRMGICGYPIEIQALFYFALSCAKKMLKPERDGKELFEMIERRMTALKYHIKTYYWLDHTQLNNIYRYKTEEYSHTAVNKFNVTPDSIPDWIFDFMPLQGGYFIGNVSPARMDFRWFLVGNCISILSSLATPEQATAIVDLIDARWDNLVGEMPLKIAYPALKRGEWRNITGCDPKNTQWSYHNGGSWPTLLWLLAAACIKASRPGLAKRAIELAEKRLSKDEWPEYYDGKTGRYVGKQARKYQTWSISGYLVAKMVVDNPTNLALISTEEDKEDPNPKVHTL